MPFPLSFSLGLWYFTLFTFKIVIWRLWKDKSQILLKIDTELKKSLQTRYFSIPIGAHNYDFLPVISPDFPRIFPGSPEKVGKNIILVSQFKSDFLSLIIISSTILSKIVFQTVPIWVIKNVQHDRRLSKQTATRVWKSLFSWKEIAV